MSHLRHGLAWCVLGATAALVVCGSPNAAAQEPVRIEFKDGRVWVEARNVTVGAILREWARVGGSTIVVDGSHDRELVSFEIDGVPERLALDIVLREASGYLAGPRATGSTGRSALGVVYVLPGQRAAVAPEPAPRRREGRSAAAPASPAQLVPALDEIVRMGFTGITSAVPTSSQPSPAAARGVVEDVLRRVGGVADSPDSRDDDEREPPVTSSRAAARER